MEITRSKYNIADYPNMTVHDEIVIHMADLANHESIVTVDDLLSNTMDMFNDGDCEDEIDTPQYRNIAAYIIMWHNECNA